MFGFLFNFPRIYSIIVSKIGGKRRNEVKGSEEKMKELFLINLHDFPGINLKIK